MVFHTPYVFLPGMRGVDREVCLIAFGLLLLWNVEYITYFLSKSTSRNRGYKKPAHKLEQAPPPVTSQDEPKIAFLFLMQQSFATSEIWRHYLTSAPQKQWSVYIHVDRGASIDFLPSFYHGFVLPDSTRTETHYCTDLVSATTALIRAGLQDVMNANFVVLSPTHMPVKSFPVLRERLLRDGSSWVCITPTEQWSSAERPKHHQWIALSRAQAVHKNTTTFIPVQNGKCQDEFFVYPPETVRDSTWPGVIDGVLRTMQVEQGLCTSYVHWPDYHIDSRFNDVLPFWFDTQVLDARVLDPISICMLKGLMDQTDFLFIRKGSDSARISRRCLGENTTTSTSPVMALQELGVLKHADGGA